MPSRRSRFERSREGASASVGGPFPLADPSSRSPASDFCSERNSGKLRPPLWIGAGKNRTRQQKAPVKDEGSCFRLVSWLRLSNSRRKHYSGSTNMGCQ